MPELFFDVETTGLPPRNAKPSDFEKFEGCRVVSIAWNLRDKDMVYSQKYAVSDPGCIVDGVVGAEHIHGISMDIINKYGSPIEAVIHEFYGDVLRSDIIVAHNLEFDRKVVASELYRMGCKDLGDTLMGYKGLCTMLSTTNLVKVKNNYGSFKWPKLEELHKFLFGHDFENAHHAMCDVDALVKCYYRLMEKYNKKKI